MTFSTEAEFEEAVIAKLSTVGWHPTVLHRPTEQDLLDNWAQILFDNNRDRDRLNNVPLTNSEMAQLVEQISALRTPLKLNQMVNGKTVSIKRDNPLDPEHLGKEVSLRIYDRAQIAGGSSRYQIAQQPQFSTKQDVYGKRRGDLLLLINGMPLFHLELKGQGIPVGRATDQIRRYAGQGVYTGLFSLVQIFVGMTPNESVYFANPGPDGEFNKDYFFHWANFNNEPVNEWHDVVQQLLSIPRAHQLIGFYTVADDSDGVLKVMRSYQLFAAERISDRVSKTDWERGVQRGGYIWHTTGSGKTMTSFKSAQLIANSKDADKVVFLMDRIELGTQSLAQYRGFADATDDVQETEDTQALVGKLRSADPANTLIVTSIQKMSLVNGKHGIRAADVEMIADKRLVFIVDEAHRTTFGDMLLVIKQTFPHALFFGFTGTPIQELNQKKDSTTATVFGDELHRYSIADGIRDKNVLGFDPIRVDTYSPDKLREEVALRKAGAETVEEVYADPDSGKAEIFEHYTDKKLVPSAGYKDHNNKYVKGIEDIVPASQYQRAEHQAAVVQDTVDNWAKRSRGSKFHAIFATSSIPEAIEYYRLFKEHAPNLKVAALYDPHADEGELKIAKEDGIAELLTDYNARYDQRFRLETHAAYKKDVANRLAHKRPHERILKTPDEQVDLLIVVDQMLTGFDSKWVNTLYLDKVLQYESIIQAFSRTNRLFGPEKPFGTIVYYRKPATMQRNVEAAVKLYSGDQPLGLFVEKLDENLEGMNNTFAAISKVFSDAGFPDFSRNLTEPAERGEFAKQFSLLNHFLEAARVQGFTWGISMYKFDDDTRTIEVALDEPTYHVLALRYRELVDGGGNGGRGDDESYYDIDAHLTTIDTGRIDHDYLNSRFEKYSKALTSNDVSEAELQALLNDVHSQFAHLSQAEQKFANMLLHDIATNDVKLDPSKSLSDYITEYQHTAKTESITRLVTAFGVDPGILGQMLDAGVTEKNLNQFNRFQGLIDTINTQAVIFHFERAEGHSLPEFKARVFATQILKDFILNGELPPHLSQNLNDEDRTPSISQSGPTISA